MKCILSNLCKRKHLCCNYCEIKTCDDRCYDNCKKCKWFNDKSLTEKELEEYDIESK